MRLAIVAAVIFMLGIGPGLVKSEGPIQESQHVHRGGAIAQAHPVWVRMAGVLKIRF
jgi:hypothetical protein